MPTKNKRPSTKRPPGKKKPVRYGAMAPEPVIIDWAKFAKSGTVEDTAASREPIENLPAPSGNLPDNLDPWTVREAIPEKPGGSGRSARSVGSNGTGTGLDEMISTNPAMVNQKITAQSNSAAAHGYTYVNDAPLYNLFDEMMDRDPIIAGCLELKVAYLLMRQHGLTLDDAAAEDERGLAIYEWVKQNLVEHPKFNYLLWSLATGASQHGRSNVETTYLVTPDGYFSVDWFWHCHPGQFEYDRRGNMFLKQNLRPGMPPVKVTDRKFIYALNPALYDNPHGLSDLYRLRYYYYFKKKGWVNCIRIADKNGVPILHIDLPDGIANIDEIEKDLRTALAGMLDDDALITKNGEKLESIDRTSGNAARLHEVILERIDAAIVRYILGAELASTVTDRGARSLGEVHERTVLTRVLPLARIVEAAVNCLIRWLVDWNFGTGAPCPFYQFDTEEATDSKEAREILKTAKALGIPVAVAEGREKLGLRAPEPGEEIIAIGDLGVSPKGELTTVDEDRAQRSDKVDPEDELEKVDEAEEAADAARVAVAAFHIFMDDPERKKFSGLFADTSLVGIMFRELFADQGRARAGVLSRRLDKIGKAAAADTRPGLVAMLKALQSDLAGEQKDIPLTLTARFKVDPSKVEGFCKEAAEHITYSVAFLAAGAAAKALSDVRPSLSVKRTRFAEEDDTDFFDLLPEGYRNAAAWMQERGVMTVAAVADMARVISDQFGTDLKETERELRREILALSRTTTLDATRQVQDLIASAVDEGSTVGDFLEGIDAKLGLDEMPGALDGYWNMVFRTEVSNAYSAQQEENENREGFRDRHWGWESYNPADGRSRKTHAPLKGKRFRKGGRAAEILGRPPFAYQCRCSMFALMASRGNSSEYSESSDAMSVAANVQKFSSDFHGETCKICTHYEDPEGERLEEFLELVLANAD